MLELVKDILIILNNYIAYIYPGLITIAVLDFLRARAIAETKNTIIKSIAISYLYVIAIQQVIVFKPEDTESRDLLPHIILVVISILLPYLYWRILNCPFVKKVMKGLGISTNIHDNPIDIAVSYEKPLWLCIYMDDQKIMYEGFLRNHMSNLEKARYIMLSQYRVSRFFEKENKYKPIYPSDETKISKKDWVILDREHITRVEIAFREDH